MLKELFELPPKKYGQYNEMEMLPYILENKKLKCIVYMIDDMGEWLIDWLKKTYDIVPEFIVMESINLQGINGIDTVEKGKFMVMEKEQYFVIVAGRKYYRDSKYKMQLDNFLKENGAYIIFDANRTVDPFWYSWYVFIKRNIEGFELLYKDLCDEISKETMVNYLKTYITGERYEGETFLEENKYWGRDRDDYCLFELNENEVILNLGGYCGDTVFQYLKGGFPFKKIISAEADAGNFTILKKHMELLDETIKSKLRLDHCFIGEGDNTIDKLYKDEKITLIEMDIEGGELTALQSGIELIKKKRPVLAVCAYHKKDDLIELPKFIKDNFEEYVFALRKYPSAYFYGNAGIQQINELVLYAIPKERYIPGDV